MRCHLVPPGSSGWCDSFYIGAGAVRWESEGFLREALAALDYKLGSVSQKVIGPTDGHVFTVHMWIFHCSVSHE